MRVTQMNAFPERKEARYREQGQIMQTHHRTNPINNTAIKMRRIFSDFQTDDYILAGIIIVLILEGCDDYILLAALGYLFIMGLERG